ncbi:MAG: hypothetical protein HUJ25_11810 [Crocinitomicaceae bacterium]|nr:hypothetical protein [Crocinitomicaceae bacterium]
MSFKEEISKSLKCKIEPEVSLKFNLVRQVLEAIDENTLADDFIINCDDQKITIHFRHFIDDNEIRIEIDKFEINVFVCGLPIYLSGSFEEDDEYVKNIQAYLKAILGGHYEIKKFIETNGRILKQVINFHNPVYKPKEFSGIRGLFHSFIKYDTYITEGSNYL